ncbi:MAG: hypothetical protein AABX83_02935 [Nanoarchaeota archaeon]
MTQDKKKQWTIGHYIGWIILTFLFVYFLFSGDDNSDRIYDLEYEIEDLRSQIECLDDHIYDLNDYINNPSLGLPIYFGC